MDLHLEEQEASLLIRLLRNRLGELRNEVRHSKDSSREYMKHKERLLSRILDKFPEGLNERAHMKGFVD